MALSNQVTVSEVWRLAFPEHTRLLAGRAHLGRVVAWAHTMRPVPPAFPRLEGHELALINVEDLRHLDDISLAEAIHGLHRANVSAIVVSGPVGQDAISVAQDVGMPLFALPGGASIGSVERDVIRLIVDREAALERYRSRIARQLAEIAMSNRGWGALADALARISQKTVVIQDAALQVLGKAAGSSPILPLRSEEVVQEVSLQPAAEGVVRRLIAPIRVEDALAGYLSLLGAPDAFGASDHIIAMEGALLCALELAKERAITGAEMQQRAQFLDDLLSGEALDPGVLARRANAFGYDPTPPQAVLALGVATGDGLDPGRLALRVREELTLRRIRGFVAVRSAALAPILVLYPIHDDTRGLDGRRLARMLLESIARQFPRWPLIAGLSRPVRRLSDIRTAVQEAEQAWSLGRKMRGEEKSRLVDAAELGVYRLLLPLEGSQVLRSFYQETIGALEAYDQQQGTDLIHTLEVYFQQLGNLSRTAEVMYVHRNTLVYRLERIAAILGIDLDDAETRLRLQLALKIRHIL
ncbi:MAG: helix-turn-helix domain-containing protein [Anaerolineae bacterium]|nr:helix-turn-helix domain-containing protein [Anaerolineae bacterium]